ncbi:MAG: trigger factor [Bacteroidales bacterium]|nr:trigger factor [Bacteroidales bacterium]
MNVRQKKVDDLNLTVTIKLEKEDWAEARKKKLNEFRRTAELKGFRKGMAPMSLIEKIHGGAALAEVINTIVSEQLNKFIEDKKLKILGEPLPSEKESKNNWDDPDTFTFDFDIALAPKVEVSVSKEDKIPFYNVATSAKALKDYKSNLLKQFGTLETGKAAKADDFVIADFEAGDSKVEKAYVALRSIKDEEIKASFVGLKKGDVRDVDIVKTFENEADRAAMFHVKKEEVATLPAVWKMTVTEVKTFVNAKLNQQTYDNIFGEGKVKTEEEFDAAVKERLEGEYAQESEYRFMIDAKEYLIKKADISLPDAFMKRWLLEANDGKFTMEEIEKEYDLFAKDFRWDMIRSEIIKAQKLQVTKEAVLDEAKKMTAYQFAMYGMGNTPDEMLTQYAQNMLKDEQQVRRVVEKVEDDLVLDYVRKTATLDTKKVSLEKMRELTA